MTRLRAVSGAFCLFSVYSGFAASQEGASETAEVPELVITATRSPLELARAGSAISVVTAEELEVYGVRNVADALRLTPGVDVTEQGGVGGLAIVRLRGSEAGQTLVLLDGVRIGDPSSTGREFYYNALALTNIERIEVLRGPQSALYGSDAMGGVVNIITRKGAREPRRSVTIEGGSYGSVSARAEISGATDVTSYSFALSGLHTDGFSRYGYRIRRIESQYPNGMERDSADKLAGSARVSHKIGDVTFDFGFARHHSWIKYDDPSAYNLDPAVQRALRDSPLERQRTEVTNVFARASGETFGGLVQNSVTVFGNSTDRFTLDRSCFDPISYETFECRSTYNGRRFGGEYQADIKMGVAGLLIVGARTEREEARNRQTGVAPPNVSIDQLGGAQVTNSVFALHQVSVGSRLDLSLGGRIDSVKGAGQFPSWRATAAYRLEETGTKLRASAGTGARAPSLYQRFSEYGNAGLLPETNFGYDAGIDQRLFGDKVLLSATWFDARYKNLIDIDWAAFPLRYYNIAEARVKGLETSADLNLWPGEWRARISYTRMSALNEVTGDPLPRRPKNKGGFSLTYSGIPKLDVEGRLIYVGRRLDSQFAPGVYVPGYVRIDVRASYAVNDNVQVFARIENLTDRRYEEIRNYGVAGRSFYGGVKVSW